MRALAFDDNKNLWAGTFNGLYVIEPNRSKVREIPVGDDGISHPSVRTICTDMQGGIWFGTYFGGLYYFNPLNNQVRTIRKNGSKGLNDNIVAVMVEDAKHRVWIGTNNGGVNLYDPATGQTRYFTAADGLGSNDVKAIYIDEERGKAYVGTHIGAMSIIDLGSGAVRSANIPSRNVFAIEPTLDGRLWLNGFSGLFLYDPATEDCSEPIDIKAGNRHLQRSMGLHRDSRKRLWVYGEDGVATFAENGGRLSPVKVLPDDVARGISDVKDVFEDSQHRIWLATNNGLRAFDGAGKELMHLSDKNGMPSHIVNTIREDHSGKLWAGTNGGLVCVDAAKGTVDRMSLYDSDNNGRISVRSIITTSSGKMMVGGIDGLRIFNPTVLETNPYAPRPRITGLRLFDKPVRPGDETGLLQKSIEATTELTFNSDQTSFTIEFTVCNFPGGGDNSFYYMLEGIDRQWIQLADGQRSVTYSNLPSGKYRFMLKAANSDGVMSEEVATMDITILPVWYLSWWAITLWVILALAIAAYIVRTVWHRKMLSAKMRMQQIDHERQQQTEEMKVRFFINLSHELRTPLTLMMLPVDELLARKNDSIVTEKLSIVKNNTLRILHIVNQMLDYRRAEMGMFKLQVHKVNINTLARDIYSSYEQLARHKNINYRLDSTIEHPEVTLDSNYIELIINNLLSNAFKYTPKGQSVALQLSQEGGELVLTVKDSGCGIPADKLDNIFTRFYQVNDSASGNGIGLSLVKRLVELHHGTITVDSKLGEGTAFTVRLPIVPEAYSAEETATADSATQSADNKADNQPYIRILDDPGDEAPETTAKTDEATEDEEKENSKPTIMVVDDNSEILKYIGDALADSYKVILAANGAKAIENLSVEKIDLIVTDVMMPDVDGMQLCRTVKRNLRTSHIPVIMLSAKSDLSDQMGGMNVGADDYMAKPFSLDLLKAKIRNQLRTRARLIDMYTGSTEIEPAKVTVNPLDEEFLSRAIKVMNEHIDDLDFSTDIFAREMFMSRSNLHLKMKALTGQSTNDFIRRVRMNKALELLKTARYTVSEVSAMVGYGTPSYFATSFKKYFGHSPSDLVKKG